MPSTGVDKGIIYNFVEATDTKERGVFQLYIYIGFEEKLCRQADASPVAVMPCLETVFDDVAFFSSRVVSTCTTSRGVR